MSLEVEADHISVIQRRVFWPFAIRWHACLLARGLDCGILAVERARQWPTPDTNTKKAGRDGDALSCRGAAVRGG